MKLKALNDIQIAGRTYKADTVFEVKDSQASVVLAYGWAEVVEEVKAPKAEKKPAKKTTKK